MSQDAYLFTSESVSSGHPDKIADQISDAILDAIIAQDKEARVACETVVKTGLVFIAGEISTTAQVDYEAIARKVILDIGYDGSSMGFDGHSCAVLTSISKQSPDIAMGVDHAKSELQGAGDQGLMFGYASDETEVLMPAPITYAHHLMQAHAEKRQSKQLPWLRPDAKTQVTFLYEDGIPKKITNIVLSTQHDPAISEAGLKEAVIEEIIKPVIPTAFLQDTTFFINPTGRFVIGGPQGDCGLTGRKIIVDTYGGMARHGGGCFSGKDPSKVDRSGAYACRYVAKNLVAAGLAKRLELQIAYAIGMAQPTSISVNTFGTETIERSKIIDMIQRHFDLTPFGIIKKLDLLHPIYQITACYGHFGRTDVSLSWEQIDDSIERQNLHH